MTKRPFFSIVIPTYNRAKTLQFTLFCLLKQNFHDFEVIISDNCSVDNTKEVIMNFHDKRIVYYRMKKTTPYANNLQNAISHAKGQYIFLHSDDDFLLYENSLKKIHGKIQKYHLGYLRINYMCLSTDKKHLFHFKFHNPFRSEAYIPSGQDNKRILDFILNSDHFFISGIVIRRLASKEMRLVHSEHAPWIGILFDAIKNYGAYFFSDPLIVANWSQWRNKKNGKHPVYSLMKGKLEFENYLSVTKRKISSILYTAFMHEQFMRCYIQVLPVIKVRVGNKTMIEISKRICQIDKSMTKSFLYWLYFLFSIITPGWMIRLIKDWYLKIYMGNTSINNKDKIIKKIYLIEKQYEKEFNRK